MSRWPYSFTVGDLMERAEQLDCMHTMQEKIRRGVDQWAFLPRDLGARQEGLHGHAVGYVNVASTGATLTLCA